MTGETAQAKRLPPREADKAEWYGGLIYFAWTCNYKKGWARHAFNARFKEFPVGLPDKRPSKAPSMEIIKWAEAYQRIQAKNYKAKLQAEGKWQPGNFQRQAIVRSKRQKALV